MALIRSNNEAGGMKEFTVSVSVAQSGGKYFTFYDGNTVTNGNGNDVRSSLIDIIYTDGQNINTITVLKKCHLYVKVGSTVMIDEVKDAGFSTTYQRDNAGHVSAYLE